MRGQPALVLGLLLGGWVVLRATYWSAPFADRLRELPGEALAGAAPDAHASGPPPVAPLPATAANALPRRPALGVAGLVEVLIDPLREQPMGILQSTPGPTVASGGETAPQSAPYQPLGVLAAMPAATPDAGFSAARWSGDSWLLLRRDTATALTSGRGSYGRSQAGAVLRYAFAPSSAFRPLAYARVSQAIGVRDSEAALGLSARPLPQIPLRAAVELRVTQSAGRTLLRPAAYAVTEIPPVPLPLGVAAEAYGQAGYVGGSYASAFVDGQLRVERPLVRSGSAHVDLGAGAWGGAQKKAARLDIGPSASLRFRLGKANARVAMDWRFRVAGNAEPASGPALTISAGF